MRTLERSRAYRAVRSVVESLDRHAATRAASAMAFDAFLSLIPLVAFAGYVLSRLHQGTDLVLKPLLRAAPAGVGQIVTEEFIRLAESTAVAPISISGFLWMSSAGLSTAMGVFETIYNSSERAWYVRRAIAAACVIASVAIAPLVAGVGVMIGAYSGWIGAMIAAVALPAGLVTCLVAAFFRIAIRRPHVERRRIFPGAVLTVGLWLLVSTLFSLYVATLGRYATFYGSLATVAISLFWLWLLSLSLLVGGELNARLEQEREGMTSLPPSGKWVADLPAAVPGSPAVPRDAAALLGEAGGEAGGEAEAAGVSRPEAAKAGGPRG
jgi:membrane protein